MCGRIDSTKEVTLKGNIKANGTTLTSKNFVNYGAYVMQDDVLLETMTVRECFQFAVNLRIKGTPEEKL